MSGQQSQSRNRFTPGLLAMGIWAATTQAALGAEEQPATTMELGATQISTDQLGSTTEGSESYTTGPMQTATKLPLTIRETPQAVTVVTRQRMDDQAMTSINDVVRYTPGLFLDQSSGPGRQTYTSRGFDIDNIMYDGLPASLLGLHGRRSTQSGHVRSCRGDQGRDWPGDRVWQSFGSDQYGAQAPYRRATGHPHRHGRKLGRLPWRIRCVRPTERQPHGSRPYSRFLPDANSFRDKEKSDHGVFYGWSKPI